MLTDNKPKAKKMAFSIENLARSSHDEPKSDKVDDASPRLYNLKNNGLNVSPCVKPNAFDNYPSVFHSGFYSPPNAYFPMVAQNLLAVPPVSLAKSKSPKSIVTDSIDRTSSP